MEQEGPDRYLFVMGNNKPGSRDRKVLYIAPLFIGCAIAVLVGAVLLLRPASRPPVKEPGRDIAAPASMRKPIPAIIAEPPPASRAELIAHAARLTDRVAATGREEAAIDPLVGRRFSLRIPFGCNGAEGSGFGSQTMVSYDAANDSETISAQPADWSVLPVIMPLIEAGKIEAAEGFWLPRPWTDSETCPPKSEGPPPAITMPATAQTLGLAQLFAPGSARTPRHTDHPYTIRRKIGPNPELLHHSYRLQLEGILTGYPDGRAAHCWAEAADQRPVCIYAMRLDRVAFLDGETGETLATWTQ